MNESSGADGADASAPPGWYQDGAGQLRWWDGTAWGATAPSPTANDPVQAGKALAALSHAGVLAGGPILPLILYLTEGKKNPYVGHHAREALNFQLTMLIVSVGAVVVGVLSLLVGALLLVGFVGIFLIWAVMVAVGLGAWVLAIVGAVRAYQGVWWNYPVSLRLVSA